MPHSIADKSLCEQKQVRSRFIFGIFDYLLVFGLLGALIGLPIATIIDLNHSSSAPLLKQGEWRILKASRATIWMALMLMIVPIAVSISIRSEFSKNPTFPIFQSDGSILGALVSALAILVAIWLVLRMRWRKIRYNDEILIAGYTKYNCADLSFVGYQAKSTQGFYIPVFFLRSPDSSKLTLQFGSNHKIIVHGDMVGRSEFIADLKQIAKKQELKFVTESRAK